MLRRASLLAFLAGMLLTVPPANAQADVLARFQQATALAADPLGNLYVVDQGARRVVRIAPSSGVVAVDVIGAGHLIEPSSLDPTNGLLILVADAATGAVHRFNRSLVWTGEHGIETASEMRRGAVDDMLDARQRPPGVPTAIAMTRDGSLAMLDRANATLRFVDRQNRVIRSVDDGELLDPIAMCIDREDRIAVLDAERGRLVVFDVFGTMTDERALPLQAAWSGLTCGADGIRAHGDDGLVRIDDGMRLVAYLPGLDGAVVATMPIGAHEFILTSRVLYRITAASDE